MSVKVCVFCSSKPEVVPRFREDTVALAQLFLKRKWTLVYGGGNQGLMGLLADEVLKGGGEVIGVFPEGALPNEVEHQGLTQLIRTSSYEERKKKFRDVSDVYIALPGGVGTLDELLEIITLKSIGLDLGPLVLHGPAGFWQLFCQLIQKFQDEGFLYPGLSDTFFVSETHDELEEVLRDIR